MKKVKVDKNYGAIPHHILYDTSLSMKAKLIRVYIQSKPEGWKFSVEKIANQMKEGITAIRNAVKELEEARLLKRIKFQDENGFWKIEYVLYLDDYKKNNDDINNENENENKNENEKTENKKQTKQTDKTTKKENIIKKEEILLVSEENSMSNNNNEEEILLVSEEETKKEEKTKIKNKEYGDPEINKLLEIIKEFNDGVIDGTIKEQRRYGKLLLDKIKKVKAVKENKYSWDEWFKMLLEIVSRNEFYLPKIAGPKKIFYELATLMQVARSEYLKEKKNQIPRF